MTDAPTCAACAVGNESVPATHRSSDFGLRPDKRAIYWCCDHAWHGGLDLTGDPVLNGAVCEVER